MIYYLYFALVGDKSRYIFSYFFSYLFFNLVRWKRYTGLWAALNTLKLVEFSLFTWRTVNVQRNVRCVVVQSSVFFICSVCTWFIIKTYRDSYFLLNFLSIIIINLKQKTITFPKRWTTKHSVWEQNLWYWRLHQCLRQVLPNFPHNSTAKTVATAKHLLNK